MTDNLQNLTYAEFLALYAPLAAGLTDPVFQEDAVTDRLWQIAVRLGENAKKFNLTAITEPCAVVEKHIVDSLLPLSILQNRGILDERMHYAGKSVTVCDIGAGAGFPSLPMAAVLAQSDGRVLAVDATAKKVRYITETAAALGLSGMTAQSGRAEELARRGTARTIHHRHGKSGGGIADPHGAVRGVCEDRRDLCRDEGARR